MVILPRRVARKQHFANSWTHKWSGTSSNRPQVPPMMGALGAVRRGQTENMVARGADRILNPATDGFSCQMATDLHSHYVIRAGSGTQIVVRTLFQPGLPVQVEDCPQSRHSATKPRNKWGTNTEFGDSIYWSGNTGSTPSRRAATACPIFRGPNTKT